jgi:adenine-specific DNA methylase
MSRAIVLGSLIPDPVDPRRGAEIFTHIRACSLFKDASVPARVEPLRELIQEAFPEVPPRVLDCFAGGGAIPLEALRLGCDVTAIDLNPVACLIEKCMLEFPQRFGQLDEQGRNQLAEDVGRWAQWVGERARERVAPAYPKGPDGRSPAVWFWARTMPCQNPACGVEIPLVKSWWLAKARRLVWLEPTVADGTIGLAMHDGAPRGGKRPDDGTVSASSVTCPACSGTLSAADVRAWGKSHEFGVRLLATLTITGRDRAYQEPTESDLVALNATRDALKQLAPLEDGTPTLPDESPNPSQYRKFGMLPFGLTQFCDLFTDRQLLVVAGALCERHGRDTKRCSLRGWSLSERGRSGLTSDS